MSKKKENTRRFVGKKGEFVSSVKHKEDKISIQYLTELCEWVFYHDNYTDKEKLKHILNCEKMIKDLLNKMISPKCKYVPFWSTKLKKIIKK